MMLVSMMARMAMATTPETTTPARVRFRRGRASPEDSQKPSPIRRFRPFENCPPDTFLAAAHRCDAPASSITFRFDRVRLSRRPLSRNAITQSA